MTDEQPEALTPRERFAVRTDQPGPYEDRGPFGAPLNKRQLEELAPEELHALLGRQGKVIPLADSTEYRRVSSPWDGMDFPTTQAEDIFTRLVPEWAGKFLEANARYRKVDNALGARGVFPDIYRKTGVLRSRVWEQADDASVGREPTRDVILDLVGHLFLMLHMLDEEDMNDKGGDDV